MEFGHPYFFLLFASIVFGPAFGITFAYVVIPFIYHVRKIPKEKQNIGWILKFIIAILIASFIIASAFILPLILFFSLVDG